MNYGFIGPVFSEKRIHLYKSLRRTDGRHTPSEGKSSPDSLGQVS